MQYPSPQMCVCAYEMYVCVHCVLMCVHGGTGGVTVGGTLAKVSWGNLGHGLTWDTRPSPVWWRRGGEDGLQSQTW